MEAGWRLAGFLLLVGCVARVHPRHVSSYPPGLGSVFRACLGDPASRAAARPTRASALAWSSACRLDSATMARGPRPTKPAVARRDMAHVSTHTACRSLRPMAPARTLGSVRGRAGQALQASSGANTADNVEWGRGDRELNPAELLEQLRKQRESVGWAERLAASFAPKSHADEFKVNWVGNIDRHQRELFWRLITMLCERIDPYLRWMRIAHDIIQGAKHSLLSCLAFVAQTVLPALVAVVRASARHGVVLGREVLLLARILFLRAASGLARSAMAIVGVGVAVPPPPTRHAASYSIGAAPPSLVARWQRNPSVPSSDNIERRMTSSSAPKSQSDKPVANVHPGVTMRLDAESGLFPKAAVSTRPVTSGFSERGPVTAQDDKGMDGAAEGTLAKRVLEVWGLIRSFDIII